jgi:hypothetical protein
VHRAEALFAILSTVYILWIKYPPEPEIEVTTGQISSAMMGASIA